MVNGIFLIAAVILISLLLLFVPVLFLAGKLRQGKITPGTAKVFMFLYVLLFTVLFVFFLGAVKSLRLW